jgi:hypothetical protein
MSFRMLEGGRCARCGTKIGSYQFNPHQTQAGGKNYCGQHCKQRDNR